VNTTLLVKHFKPLFYLYKHKYKTKQIKKQQKHATNNLLLDQQDIFRTTTLFWLFFEKIYLLQTCKA
jgi:hypothetical protein